MRPQVRQSLGLDLAVTFPDGQTTEIGSELRRFISKTRGKTWKLACRGSPLDAWEPVTAAKISTPAEVCSVMVVSRARFQSHGTKLGR